MLASNQEVVEQMLSMTFCVNMNISVTHSVVMILLVLAYSPETHPHIIKHNKFAKFLKRINENKVAVGPPSPVIIELSRYLIIIIICLYTVCTHARHVICQRVLYMSCEISKSCMYVM